MNEQEFQQRTGIDLTDEQYSKVEDIYMLCDNIDKDEFCKDYRIHGGSLLLDIFTNQVKAKNEQLTAFRKMKSEMVDFLLYRAQKFGDSELLNKAISMVGHAEVIIRKIDKNIPLWDIDRKYIRENIE